MKSGVPVPEPRTSYQIVTPVSGWNVVPISATAGGAGEAAAVGAGAAGFAAGVPGAAERPSADNEIKMMRAQAAASGIERFIGFLLEVGRRAGGSAGARILSPGTPAPGSPADRASGGRP